MVGPPAQDIRSLLFGNTEDYSVSFHTNDEGKVIIQILNGNHSRIFVGTKDDVQSFIDALMSACVRAESIELALKGN